MARWWKVSINKYTKDVRAYHIFQLRWLAPYWIWPESRFVPLLLLFLHFIDELRREHESFVDVWTTKLTICYVFIIAFYCLPDNDAISHKIRGTHRTHSKTHIHTFSFFSRTSTPIFGGAFRSGKSKRWGHLLVLCARCITIFEIIFTQRTTRGRWFMCGAWDGRFCGARAHIHQIRDCFNFNTSPIKAN